MRRAETVELDSEGEDSNTPLDANQEQKNQFIISNSIHASSSNKNAETLLFANKPLVKRKRGRPKKQPLKTINSIV